MSPSRWKGNPVAREPDRSGASRDGQAGEAARVSAAAPVAGGRRGSAAAAAPAEEKTEFDVILTGFGGQKFRSSRSPRITGLGLRPPRPVEGVPKPVKEAAQGRGSGIPARSRKSAVPWK